jgi:Cu-Zn family superoxide dismutase
MIAKKKQLTAMRLSNLPIIAVAAGLSALVLLPLATAADAKLDQELDPAPLIENVTELIAVLEPTEGNRASGVVMFKQGRDGKVEITGRVEGLTPNSMHGFHVHQYGDVSAPNGASAGDHYNPLGHKHALPEEKVRHAGDFGNLEADADGVANFRLVVDNISMAGRRNPIIGRGLIVHAKADTGAQPSGDAGDRIASAVIGIRDPKAKKE